MTDVEDASWADGEAAESAPEPIAELVDFTAVRDKVQTFLGAGESPNALGLLEQLARWPDSTRHLTDNVWLYETLGNLHRETGSDEDAVQHYQRGFELEPRELSLLRSYSTMLFAVGRFDEALKVVQSMLLHHKRSLPEEELASIYRQLGDTYEALEHYEKARLAFDKALEQSPGDQAALTGLLRVVPFTADPMEVIRVRQKLIRSLDSAQMRSMALLALGDDWVNEFNDPRRALDVYEQAILEHPENRYAFERISKVAAEAGDWRRVVRANLNLAELAEDGAKKADWIIQASLVTRDQLWESDKALRGFRTALQLDPTRLDAFRAVTSLLVDAQDWDGLEAAYVQVISANVEAGNDEPKLMAVLWQKLGDLYRLHLNREGDAIFAYEQAAARFPGNPQFHTLVADLAETHSDHLDKALVHLRALHSMDPSNMSYVERLGKVYLRQKDVDRALCMYRVLAYRGHALDEKARNFVDKLDSPMFRPIDSKLTPAVLKGSLFSENLDPAVSDLFAALKVGLDEWTGEAHSKYGLKRRDRVKLDEPLVFNRIYKSVGETLGYQSFPDLWHKPDVVGLVNGALVPEGLIAGDDLLGSGREEYAAFIIGKQLFLFLRPFYLAGIRPATDLQVFFILGASCIRDDMKVELTKDRESAMKAIKKRVKGKDYELLKRSVDRLSQGEVDLNAWVEAVEDTANRVGLLFCDDLNAAKEYLQVEPQKVGNRSVEARMESLLLYAASEKFLDLRQRLGIAVS